MVAPAISSRGERILRGSKNYYLRSSGDRVYIGSLLGGRVVGGSLWPGDMYGVHWLLVVGSDESGRLCGLGEKFISALLPIRPSDSILSETKNSPQFKHKRPWLGGFRKIGTRVNPTFVRLYGYAYGA